MASWPGKDALRIRREDALGMQIPAIGYEAFSIGLPWVWKE